MKSLEWAMTLFFSSISVCLLSINIFIMCSAYKIMMRLEKQPECTQLHIDDVEGRLISDIKVSECVRL